MLSGPSLAATVGTRSERVHCARQEEQVGEQYHSVRWAWRQATLEGGAPLLQRLGTGFADYAHAGILVSSAVSCTLCAGRGSCACAVPGSLRQLRTVSESLPG